MPRPKPIPKQDWIDPPKGVSRSFKAGWKARLKGKTNDDCRIYPGDGISFNKTTKMLEYTPIYWKILHRKQDWHRGYLYCSRALGRVRKAARVLEETIRLNKEYDMFAELAEELAA